MLSRFRIRNVNGGERSMSVGMFRRAGWRAISAVERFRSEMRGVAAVEFAFIAPIMLLLLVGTIELSAGVSVNRKLSRASSTISDLVTQSQQLTCNDVENIMDVSSRVMYPYTRNDEEAVVIIVTQVKIDNNGNATVDWSRSRPDGHGFTPGSPYDVPSDIRKKNSYLVAARLSTDYRPSFGWAHYSAAEGLSFDKTVVPMEEEIFLRPRIGDQVTYDPICS